MSCGVGHRHSLDLALLWLWLWCWLAVAGPIRPLAWELPYATGEALKKAKKKKKANKKKNPIFIQRTLSNATYMPSFLNLG